MAFIPVRLCVVYDPVAGLCARVLPRMRAMLEQRAFDVDVHALGDGPPPSLADARGVVIGSPVVGVGVRRLDPTPRVLRYLREAEGLAERRVACFTVARLRLGDSSARLRAAVRAVGADVVVDHGYLAWAPARDEHVLPAECMVRIR